MLLGLSPFCWICGSINTRSHLRPVIDCVCNNCTFSKHKKLTECLYSFQHELIHGVCVTSPVEINKNRENIKDLSHHSLVDYHLFNFILRCRESSGGQHWAVIFGSATGEDLCVRGVCCDPAHQ